LPRPAESRKKTKARKDSSRHMVSKELFPLQIDRDVRLNLLELRDALDLFKLVDSNRAHLREWLPFIDDYQSTKAAGRSLSAGRVAIRSLCRYY